MAERCGARRGSQLGAFINAIIDTVCETGVVGMDAHHAEALAAFRAFNYERIYLRDASREQADRVVAMLRSLVEHYVTHPELVGDQPGEPLERAVAYVAGMTDRFACRRAVALLDWPEERLPTGIDR